MTQDEIIEMARESGMELYGLGKDRARFVHHLVALANLVAAKEREACAKVVESIEAQCIAKDVDDPPLEHVAAAIRARGQA